MSQPACVNGRSSVAWLAAHVRQRGMCSCRRQDCQPREWSVKASTSLAMASAANTATQRLSAAASGCIVWCSLAASCRANSQPRVGSSRSGMTLSRLKLSRDLPMLCNSENMMHTVNDYQRFMRTHCHVPSTDWHVYISVHFWALQMLRCDLTRSSQAQTVTPRWCPSP